MTVFIFKELLIKQTLFKQEGKSIVSAPYVARIAPPPHWMVERTASVPSDVFKLQPAFVLVCYHNNTTVR